MQRLTTLVLTIAVSLVLTASLLQAADEIRISVPASMTDAVRELAAQFTASGHQVTIVPNSGPSGTLAKQIVEGASADLFISANRKWMTYLRDEQRIDPQSEKILAANTLVFVGAKN
ncbi:MAG: molybdate ABC transporter substrate-binding protein, partial [Desulfobulbus sp.]|nr:molybdate ABC transporter substrate-binding protein [Desulfobulbus sp.]